MIPLLPQITAALVAQSGESDDSVEAARDALSQWGRYPWYDSDADGLEPVDIVEPYDWSWLWDWLNFSWGGGGGGSWNWVSVLSWGLIIIVLCVLTWLLVHAYRRRFRGTEILIEAEGESPEEERRRIEALPKPARRQSGLLAEAHRYYTEGNFDEAVIYLFSHQLLYLDRHHLIHLTRGKTNRQYLRELQTRRQLQQMLAGTTVAFEDVFFGDRSIGRERFEACWHRLQEFETLAAQEAGR